MINDDYSKVNDEKNTTSKCFYYKIRIIYSTLDDNSRLDTEAVAPLKCLSSFWRSNDSNTNAPVPADAATTATSATFRMNTAKLYVPVVTLSINDNIKGLENIKQVFKITVSWNKYRSK